MATPKIHIVWRLVSTYTWSSVCERYQTRVNMLWYLPWHILQNGSNFGFRTSGTSSCIFVFYSCCNMFLIIVHLVSFRSSVTFCMHIMLWQWIYQHSVWENKKSGFVILTFTEIIFDILQHFTLNGMDITVFPQGHREKLW